MTPEAQPLDRMKTPEELRAELNRVRRQAERDLMALNCHRAQTFPAIRALFRRSWQKKGGV